MTFVSAWTQAPLMVVYKDSAGQEWIRKGGSRSWRNCNPGNISKGTFADTCGAIGGDTRFAIFPDETTGSNAIVSLMKSAAYRNLSIQQANALTDPSDWTKLPRPFPVIGLGSPSRSLRRKPRHIMSVVAGEPSGFVPSAHCKA